MSVALRCVLLAIVQLRASMHSGSFCLAKDALQTLLTSKSWPFISQQHGAGLLPMMPAGEGALWYNTKHKEACTNVCQGILHHLR
eukprot:3558018-Amphidinium_carterae.1